jgi:exosortase/archaeosortase family protein
MQLQSAGNLASRLWQRGMRDRHSQIVTIGLLFMACYLPTWLGVIGHGILEGKSDSILNFGFIFLGLQTIHAQRNKLKSLTLGDKVIGGDDRAMGYGLMLLGIITFIYFHSVSFSVSFQALAVILILLGIAGSSWGLPFFGLFPISTLYLLISVYPDTSFIAIRICRYFTSEDMLEQVMAWAGSIGLNTIGFKAISEAAYVRLPNGAVWVGPGCSGFDMAYTIVGCSLLFGLFMKVSWRRIVALITIGWALAMACNVPRIMLLAIAAINWGKESFEFWHGPIGGQIFSMIMFTIYYYIAMWLVETKNPPTGTPKDV